eukprot:4887157-Pyramimonas_sp.AAC.1
MDLATNQNLPLLRCLMAEPSTPSELARCCRAVLSPCRAGPSVPAHQSPRARTSHFPLLAEPAALVGRAETPWAARGEILARRQRKHTRD